MITSYLECNWARHRWPKQTFEEIVAQALEAYVERVGCFPQRVWAHPKHASTVEPILMAAHRLAEEKLGTKLPVLTVIPVEWSPVYALCLEVEEDV